MVPGRATRDVPSFAHSVAVDPFDHDAHAGGRSTVALDEATPTVPSAPTAQSAGRRLTAILIADERRVAVIDETAVAVGDVLRDGSRVSAIQPDRVWVVERNGGWQMLTLSTRGR